MKTALVVTGPLRGYRFAMPTWKDLIARDKPAIFIQSDDAIPDVIDAAGLLISLCIKVGAPIQMNIGYAPDEEFDNVIMIRPDEYLQHQCTGVCACTGRCNRRTFVDKDGNHEGILPGDVIAGITRPMTLEELAYSRGVYT